MTSHSNNFYYIWNGQYWLMAIVYQFHDVTSWNKSNSTPFRFVRPVIQKCMPQCNFNHMNISPDFSINHLYHWANPYTGGEKNPNKTDITHTELSNTNYTDWLHSQPANICGFKWATVIFASAYSCYALNESSLTKGTKKVIAVVQLKPVSCTPTRIQFRLHWHSQAVCIIREH